MTRNFWAEKLLSERPMLSKWLFLGQNKCLKTESGSVEVLDNIDTCLVG